MEFESLCRTNISSSLVAGMLGFPVKDYLQTEEAKKDMPDMKR